MGAFHRSAFRIVFSILALSCLSAIFVSAADDYSQHNFDNDRDDLDDDDWYDPEEFVSDDTRGPGTHDADDPHRSSETQTNKQNNESESEDEPQNFYVEFGAIGFVVVYAANFLYGRRENEKIARKWQAALSETFRTQFHELYAFESNQSPHKEELTKESQSCFKFYASGRRNCTGLLATIELKRRHDLFSFVLAMVDMAPSRDTVTIEIALNDGCVGPFVFCICRKQEESKWRYELEDIKQFGVTVSSNKLPKHLSLITDCPSLETDLLNDKVLNAIGDNKKIFSLMHISDQNAHGYGGSNVLRFCYNIPEDGKFDQLQRLTEMAIYYIDRVAALKMTPAARLRGEKARQRVEAEKMRASHAERQEAHAKKKEDMRLKEKAAEAMLTAEQARKKEAKEEKMRSKKGKPKFKIMR